MYLVVARFLARSRLILTHWSRVTHLCVSDLTTIGSDNDLSPGRRQAIIWTNARILLIGPVGTIFSEILIEIHTFSFKKMYLKMSSAKWCLFHLGLNVLINSSMVIGTSKATHLTVLGISNVLWHRPCHLETNVSIWLRWSMHCFTHVHVCNHVITTTNTGLSSIRRPGTCKFYSRL